MLDHLLADFIPMLIGAYLLGSIPTAVWLSQGMYGTDIRDHGSGNAGSTNTYRVLGLHAGLVVQLLDIAKGYLAAALPDIFLSMSYVGQVDAMWMMNYLCGVAAVFGHIYPVFADFRGGKGMNTVLGMMLFINPWASLIAVGTFLVVLLVYQYVSLASMLAVFTLPIYLLIKGLTKGVWPNDYVFVIAAALPFLVMYTHRTNIQRLLQHNENKVRIWKRKRRS